MLGLLLCSSAADPRHGSPVRATAVKADFREIFFAARRLSDSTECDAPCQPGQFKALPLVALCGGGGCTVEAQRAKIAEAPQAVLSP